jgi:hypothetical protein
MNLFFLFVLNIAILSSAFGNCLDEKTQLNDLLALVLKSSTECPENVIELKKALLSDGIHMKATMVANRGFQSIG